MNELTHIDKDGRIKMVDVGEKNSTARVAVATGFVYLNAETLAKVKEGSGPKGDPLEISRIAGIMGAKETSRLIPLCHQIALSAVNIDVVLENNGVRITAEAKTVSQTGVEMEALTAVSIAALTIYDMCKAVQKDIVIGEICLVSKTGGKSDYTRD